MTGVRHSRLHRPKETLSMSRLIALAAVLGAGLIPAAANAATAPKLSGVVVSKETARLTLVLASSHGNVTTVRTTAQQLQRLRVGSRIAVTGLRLADGSFHATKIARSGTSSHTRIKVTVLRASAKQLLVAGGGSAFAIRLQGATQIKAASHNGLSAGDQIDSEVELSHGGLVGDSVQAVGQTVLVDFSGKVTAFDASSLTVTDDGTSTVVTIPDGVTLPQLVQIGSEVEIVASVSGSTLTLVEVKLDGDGAQNGDDGGSDVSGDATVHVEGFVTSVDTSSITIQPGDNASPVTLAIPNGFTLPAGLAAGSPVDARGDVVNTVLRLTRLELRNDGGDSGETVTALDATSVTIQPDEGGTALTFAIPNGFTLPGGLQVGSLVSAKGDLVSSVLTVTKLELQDGGGDGGNGGD